MNVLSNFVILLLPLHFLVLLQLFKKNKKTLHFLIKKSRLTELHLVKNILRLFLLGTVTESDCSFML